MLLTLLAWGKYNGNTAVVTSVTAYASSWRVLRQHVHFHLRASIPMEGEIHQGQGEWHVYRGGVRLPDESAYGVLDFAWVGLPGDEVKCRFIDRDGNFGDWETYTFEAGVAATYVQYVDSVAGNDSNDGLTEGAAIASVSLARTRVAAAITTAGQSAVVHLKRGGTYAFTAAGPLWDGRGITTFNHQVQFVAYGTGARPLVQASGGAATAFYPGPHGSLHLAGIEIDGVIRTTFVGSVGVNLQRNGAGTRSPLDLCLDDFLIRNCETAITIEDNTLSTDAQLAEGRNDFTALRDGEIRDVGNWAMYQDPGLRFHYQRRVTMHRQQPEVDTDRNLFRCSNWLHSFVFGCTWAARTGLGTDGGVRWQAGQGGTTSISTWRYGSYLDCTYSATNQNLAAWRIGRKAPDGASSGLVADVRFVNCRTNSGKLAIGAEGGSSGNDVERVQLWNCTVGGVIDIGYLNGGVVRSFEVRDCASSAAGTTASAHIRMLGGPARYAANSITITGHVGLHPNTAGNRALLDTGRCTAAQAAAIVSPASNRNHVGRYGDATVPWFVQGGFFPGPPSFYDLTLAQWRTERTTLVPGDLGDASSTATANSQLGVTAPGTAAAFLDDFNPAYSSGIGPLDGLGSSRPYSLDAAGFLRSSPSDPGPFEFGASTVPTLPPSAGLIATGVAELGLASSGSATAIVIADGVAFLGMVGVSMASTRISAQGAAAIGLRAQARVTGEPGDDLVTLGAAGSARLGLSSAADAAVTTPAPPFGCQITNTSASRFVGWWHVNTDLPVSEAFGQRSGTAFVRGEPSGVDTRMVSVLVDLAPGATLVLPDFVAETATAPAVPTVPSNFFGGNPTLGGVAMTLFSTVTDGQATVQEWRLRSGVWMVYLWTTWVPGEPWARCEVVILHSNPTSASFRENWPGWLLTWGTGTVQAIGRSADGSLVASGRGYGDGQCQPRPVLVWWPSRYRDAQDAVSVAALQGGGVMGHAIQKLLHDGTPLERVGTAGWAASTASGHLSRLDNWDEDGGGIRKAAGPPGNQGDHMFTGEEPRYYVDATWANYLAACRWGAKPCHHVEVDGRYVDLVARPSLRMFDGRPHPPTTGDLLGKPGPINPAIHSEGWDGPGMEHDLTNRLDAATRYTGSRALGWILGAKANLYLGSRFPPGFGSNSALFSTRGLMIEAANAVHIWRDLRDRTLATALRDRVRVRATGIYAPWIYPTHGYPPSYWQVYVSTSASVPFQPGYIPWQQGPCAYFLDLAQRVFGGLEVLADGILAGAYQVLEDVWVYEFSPTFGVERWVEYEQQELPKPWGLGRKGRDGTWATTFLPPVIALIRRVESGNAQANAIWSQMIAQLGGGGSWLPPSGEEAASESARGAARLGLGGFGAATVQGGPALANGAASIGLAGAAAAEVSEPVPTTRGEGSFWLHGDAFATAPQEREDRGRNFRRPYWIWLWRQFRK